MIGDYAIQQENSRSRLKKMIVLIILSFAAMC